MEASIVLAYRIISRSAVFIYKRLKTQAMGNLKYEDFLLIPECEQHSVYALIYMRNGWIESHPVPVHYVQKRIEHTYVPIKIIETYVDEPRVFTFSDISSGSEYEDDHMEPDLLVVQS